MIYLKNNLSSIKMKNIFSLGITRNTLQCSYCTAYYTFPSWFAHVYAAPSLSMSWVTVMPHKHLMSGITQKGYTGDRELEDLHYSRTTNRE